MREIAKMIGTRWQLLPLELLRARTEAGMTQQRLADACGWSKNYVSKMENGRVRTLGAEAVDKLCDALNADVVQ